MICCSDRDGLVDGFGGKGGRGKWRGWLWVALAGFEEQKVGEGGKGECVMG